jgi:bacteriocin biosynthesis cyclodehydratase domain-containing protein
VKHEPPAPAPLSLLGTRVVHLEADEAVLKRGLAEVRLRFPGISALLDRVRELADGTLDEDSLVEAFDSEVQPQVRWLITGLRARGLIHQLPTADPAELFWLSVAPYAPDAVARLADASALVVGTGAVAASVTAALQDCGVGRVGTRDALPCSGSWDVWCAASENPDEPAESGLLRIAEVALKDGVVCLPVWLEDLVVRIGPMTYPFDTACLRCYLLRADSNDPEREIHRLLRGQRGEAHSGAGFLPPMVSVAGQVAAMEIVKHLTGLPVSTAGHAIELSLVPFRCNIRRVLRVPRCPACSGVARQGAPVVAHASQLAE